MTSVGETLRRERMRRNIDLEQVSRELKISSRFLRAIEEERFEHLPGGVFTKSFVRQYAHFLDLDEEEMGSEVQRLVAPQGEVTQETNAMLTMAPIHVPRLDHWQSATERRYVWSSWAPSAAMLVIAILACSGIYVWWQRGRDVTTAKGPAVAAESNPKTNPATAERSTEPPAQPTPPDQTPPGPQPAEAVPPSPNSGIQVALTAVEAVWVSARADGKVLFSGTLTPNETRTIEAAETLTLRVGNAGGITITQNGTPIGEVGPKGQVRTIQFTPGGFQIVAAPRSSPLPPGPL